MGSRSLLAILSTRPFGGFFFGVIMLKKIYLALAILAGLLSPAHSAGTIPWSLSQQLDALGKPLAGCKLYIYAAGTTTPQSVYQDTALTNAWPNPLICDSAGRLPQFFIADGLVKIRITDKNGVTQAYAGQGQIDNILVIGPSSGGGGGGGVIDPTTIMATGDIKARWGSGVLTGFVRLNGRTIGSATSGAAERANADCQALFEYLWTDNSQTVSGGRGASANADWVANKTITVPDFRGRFAASDDSMGNSAASRLTSTYLGSVASIGAVGGAQSHTLTALESAILAYTSSSSVSDPGHSHAFAYQQNSGTVGGGGPLSASNFQTIGSAGSTTNVVTGVGVTTTTTSNAGGQAFSIVPPTIIVTSYIKL